MVKTAVADKQAVGGAIVSHDGIQNHEVIAFYDAHGTLIGAEEGLSTISEMADSGNFLPAANKGSLSPI
jgi:hypothetical protein